MCRCTDHPMDAAGSAHSAEVDARWESERAQFDAVGVHVVHEARQGLVKPCAPSRRACRRSLFPSAVAHASPPRTGWYQGGLGGQRRVSRKRGGRKGGEPFGPELPEGTRGRTGKASPARSTRPSATWLEPRRGASPRSDLHRDRRRARGSPADRGIRFGREPQGKRGSTRLNGAKCPCRIRSWTSR
jgi:hypothetical protein